MDRKKFSVAISVYGKDDPKFFDRALKSIIVDQTVMPDEIVLVCDGPLNDGLNDVINKYVGAYNIFNLIRLEKNGGLGNALRIAVENSKYNLIARMDSDDISEPTRFEQQLAFFEKNPDVDVVGGNITEFIGEETNIVARRTVPITDAEIKRYMKKRCALNHVSVMYKKEAVTDAGGYLDWHFNEDYYLWIRMQLKSKKFFNTGTDLVNVRIGADMYARRGGWKYYKSEKGLQKIMLNNKMIGFGTYFTKAVDDFCAAYDGVVIVDHSSHYWGKYRILPTIVTAQEKFKTNLFDIDLLIHIGEEHGDYFTAPSLGKAKEVWRVSLDGEIRDTYKKLTNIFEMSETAFFRHYADKVGDEVPKCDYLMAFKKEVENMYQLVPELPFSNIYLAQQIIPRFPSNAALELGVSNTMRAWTFFDFKKETYTLANTGCRGIDGAIPTLLGMSLAEKSKLHFAVMGDLTFFYSFNVLANRHVGNNLRVLLVNNGFGMEFHIYIHRAFKIYDGNHEKINEYVAAGGHNGRKSKQFIKHYAEDLGFEYLSASNKDEFLKNIDRFLTDQITDKPMLFEVFTDDVGENEALKTIRNLKVNVDTPTAREKVSKIVPKGVKSVIKKIIGKK